MRIHAEQLGKRFNREWVFKNFNFTFKSGSTYAITGPNGSGKSTLMQVLWGQMPPSAGRLEYRQQDRDIPADEIFRKLSIATPYMELIDEFTLLEMVSFHFRFKSPRQGYTTREIIGRMELDHAREKYISNFSSGMRQRVKLALAFYSDTPVLFLDEPTTNLDKKSIGWYQENLRQLPADCLLIIASNQEHEYPATAEKIDLMSLK